MTTMTRKPCSWLTGVFSNIPTPHCPQAPVRTIYRPEDKSILHGYPIATLRTRAYTNAGVNVIANVNADFQYRAGNGNMRHERRHRNTKLNRTRTRQALPSGFRGHAAHVLGVLHYSSPVSGSYGARAHIHLMHASAKLLTTGRACSWRLASKVHDQCEYVKRSSR
jgi:hypothetical protein